MKRRLTHPQSTVNADINDVRQQRRRMRAAAPKSRRNYLGKNSLSTREEMHKERSTFAETLNASEVCASTPPKEHVARPPTVIWHVDRTVALDQLNSNPEYALAPPVDGAKAPISKGPLESLDGPWYVQPYLDQIVKRGALGYGSLHSQPKSVSGIKSRHSPKRESITDTLSTTQVRVLEGQNNGARNFITRVRRILREKRRESMWSIGDFMGDVEHECAERVVHVSCIAKTSSDSGGRVNQRSHDAPHKTSVLDVTLGYSMDMGGRYFIALRWMGLSWPSRICQTAPRDPYSNNRIKWTDIEFHPTQQRPDMIRYTCQCDFY